MLHTNLFINIVVCWSPKMVTILSSRRKFFRWRFSDISLLATSSILCYEASRRILLLTTWFFNSIVCWLPNVITILSSRRKFFRWHLSDISLLATSWILFYEALRRIMLLNTSFINSVVCCSPKTVKILYSHRQFFLDISHCLLPANSWILYEALKLMLPTTSFINGVVCWSTKMVTVLSSRPMFFRWRLSGNSTLETSRILFYEAFQSIMLTTTLFINSVVCWSSKIVTTLFSHRKFFCWSPFYRSLLAFSWVLSYEAFQSLMLTTTLFINNVVCCSP